ncbi:MAG TPA: beta-ketoacyl-ACP synthase III [Thermoanaerobaculia bacterium]|jgi:3-oxoacyl-[acyl-carrier-protein] synthase-3|nr:beta-ketoacyl-ACP synthase III [Thermoanaerobaculia bacterium]
MRTIITGTGIGIPKNVVTNHDLSRVMDTSDEWIRTRSGVAERRYVDDGQGSSDLGVMAAEQALAAAGKTKDDIDAIVFATMTPDHFFPGNGPVLQAKMGFSERTPTFDIRQQCSGFLYGLDLADSLIRSGKYKRILLIGADVHTPFMPWQNNWDLTIGKSTRETTPEEYAANTAIRDRTVLFGDGGGAVVIEASDDDSRGLLAVKLFTNGGNIEALYTPGVGFRRRPFVDHQQLDAYENIPVMEGREVFKQAVSKMPEAVREVCADAGIEPSQLDLLIVHQANLRIIEAVAKQLGLPAEKVPHNIERYGNTTAGTLPILFHELVQDGRVKPGMLICFTALGSGLHWGAALYRA